MVDFACNSRRRFLQMASLGGVAATVLGGCAAAVPPASETDHQWLGPDAIKAVTRVPVFPAVEFPVERYGAVGDGETDCSKAIAAAIAACHQSGGGRVVLASGVYRTGPIHLLSGVELHVADGAELSFVTDPARYLPLVFTRWEGMEMMGYSPLIYAHGQKDVAVTGSGTLNGNADADTWWPWKGAHSERDWRLIPGQDQKAARARLFELAERGVPVAERRFGEGSYLRPPFIQFYDCRGVLVDGITVKNSPFWLIHPVLSEDVTVRSVNCHSHGPNSDGCNPESCNRVVIEDCLFDTGDDCIAVKSGRNNDGRRLNTPSENLLVQNCVMRAGHGGVVIGSEISAGVRNLHVRDCVMSSPELERAIRIKTNAARGGVIEHIRYHNIRVGEVQDVVVVNFYYEEGDKGQWQPTVRDVEISGLKVEKARQVFVLRGFPRNPVRGLRLRDCTVFEAGDIGVIENVSDIQLRDVRVNGELLPETLSEVSLPGPKP